ncbi:MAG: hypothetical protein P4L56_09080 [Candidatus Sulfopaludibacter sp.]|nr:hypothetical protein [Candidatus Sulfopaludibacter sp.]
MSERTQKLVSIRRRTDQDLLVLVSRELDRGVALANFLTTRTSPYFAQAEKAHQTATTLLSKISGLSDGDRVRIESSLNELRSRLDRVSAFARTERYPATFAS